MLVAGKLTPKRASACLLGSLAKGDSMPEGSAQFGEATLAVKAGDPNKPRSDHLEACAIG